MHHEKMISLGSMAAGIAHEIGNPLSSISTIVQLLQRKVESPYFKEKLSLAHAHINRISQVVKEIFGFSRIPSAEWKFVQINDVIQDAINITKYDRRLKHVQMTLMLNPNIPRTMLIENQMVQLFLNLILNAADAIDKKNGHLIIKTSAQSNTIHITVSDNGCGIPPDIQDKIFETFFYNKRNRKRHRTGPRRCLYDYKKS